MSCWKCGRDTPDGTTECARCSPEMGKVEGRRWKRIDWSLVNPEAMRLGLFSASRLYVPEHSVRYTQWAKWLVDTTPEDEEYYCP